MIDRINDIKKALDAGAYLSALALTLALPDICAQIAYPELKGNGKSKERYRRWYDENITPYNYPQDLGDCKILNGDMCYKLRCTFLHSGDMDEMPLDDFELQVTDSACESGGVSAFGCSWTNDEIDNKKYIIRLDVGQFCFWVYSAAESFYKKNKNSLNFDDSHIKLINFDAEVGKT